MALNGLFGSILKGIATAIGTAIGGPVGGAIASQLFEWADNVLFNNNLTPNTSIGFGSGMYATKPLKPGAGSNSVDIPAWAQDLHMPNNAMTPEELKNKKLEKWLKQKITTAWVNQFFGFLNHPNKDYTTDWYRKQVNTILLRLETLRLYYKHQANVVQQKKSFGLDLNIQEVIAEAEINSKAELFQVLQQALRNAYEKALKSESIKIYQKVIPAFKAEKYSLQGTAPEPVSFNAKVNSSIKLYVFNPNENLSVTYTDGSTSTTTAQAEIPETPSVQETTTSSTATNAQFKTAGLWLLGLLGAGWAWKNLIKSKPQNQ